jgi:hypothetical protein
MTEKQLLDNFHREDRKEISVAAGLGTRGAKELIINGKGEKEGYVGDIIIRRQTRDGYKSSYETKDTGVEAVVTSSGHGSYSLTAGGEYGYSQRAERGTRTMPTPNAGFEDSVSRISVQGNSTLEDGSFFKGHANVDSLSRELDNHSVAFSEEQTVFSIGAGASYNKKLHEKFRGKAEVEVKSDKFSVSGGADRKFTKTVLSLGGNYDISDKSELQFGLKSMSLMDRDRTAPYARLDYRWEKPWQAIISYDEDLGNDSLEKILMPARYVVSTPLEASRKKTLKGAVNYRTTRGDTLGIEVFSQTEHDALEYLDINDPVRAMLTSGYRFLDRAKRRGTTLKGQFKLENSFRFNIAGTWQTPENDVNGQRISYEPEKILDVGVNYSEGKWMVDFTRRAEFERTARTLTTEFSAEDYSRSDLAIRYRVNDRFSAYMKIKDIYDEAKEIRYNVPEEGRVTLAGIEAHF